MSSETVAHEAAELFQQHRDELGFVNRAQCREGDLVTERRDGKIVGTLLGNHCAQKPQSTIYELAVAEECRREGIASSLVDEFADESPHDKLVAKCPRELPATRFYEARNWTLVMLEREDSEKRTLNVYERYL